MVALTDDPTGVGALCAAIHQRTGQGRVIVAIAGPPAAGKSTLSDALIGGLDAGGASTAVLAQDGFHYDDAVLEARGHRARKGAPHTFDVGGLASALARLRARDEAAVAVPVFDRDLEVSRGSARIIPRETQVIIVEGNWLLLDQPPWGALAPFFDLTALIMVEEAVLRERLSQRWRGYDLSAEAIRAKIEDNDMPNARLVLSASRKPDFHLTP